MKRLVCFCLIIALLVGGYMAIMRHNDGLADDVLRRLLEYPLPEGAALLDSVSVAARRDGNGNGMQYYGAILLGGDLDEAALLDHYAPLQDDNSFIEAAAQPGPVVEGYNLPVEFALFPVGRACWRVSLIYYSAPDLPVVSEWHALLDLDYRGH